MLASRRFVDVKPYLADGNVEDAILKAVEIKPREHLIEMGVLQKSICTESEDNMELSHVDENGAKMVDVGEKSATKRTAVARGEIKTKPETIILLTNKETPKGDVLNTARVAGIMAAKTRRRLSRCAITSPLTT